MGFILARPLAYVCEVGSKNCMADNTNINGLPLLLCSYMRTSCPHRIVGKILLDYSRVYYDSVTSWLAFVL